MKKQSKHNCKTNTSELNKIGVSVSVAVWRRLLIGRSERRRRRRRRDGRRAVRLSRAADAELADIVADQQTLISTLSQTTISCQSSSSSHACQQVRSAYVQSHQLN